MLLQFSEVEEDFDVGVRPPLLGSLLGVVAAAEVLR